MFFYIFIFFINCNFTPFRTLLNAIYTFFRKKLYFFYFFYKKYFFLVAKSRLCKLVTTHLYFIKQLINKNHFNNFSNSFQAKIDCTIKHDITSYNFVITNKIFDFVWQWAEDCFCIYYT